MWLADGSVSVRPGWGVLAELDTTLGSDITYNAASAPLSFFTTNVFGYEKHLGSAFVETNFGHQQIVSVFVARVSTGSLGADARVGRVSSVYAVRVFDVTTGRSWEEILTRKTSELGRSSKITDIEVSGNYPSEWYGGYETAFDRDNTGFLSGDLSSEWFFFTSRGYVYFGSDEAGVFVYRPADFIETKSMQTETDSLFNWSSGYSETGLIERVYFSNGVFEDGFVYASPSNISKIVAAASFRGRVAYATEYEIWFSDVGRPNNVIAKNFINVPSNRKVTAMYEFKGNLVIFTDREMYLYIPSEGTIVSQGRPPVKVSESVGCIGQQAITMMEDNLAWVAHSGVFSSSSGTDLKELSEPIRAFWGGHGLMTNPMTSYYEANAGWVDIDTTNPPRTLLSFDPDRVSLAYNHDKRTLLMGCPSVNGCWAFGGLWSWWPVESTVNTNPVSGAPIVGSTSNLIEPWVLANTEDIFCVSGAMYDEIPDAAYTLVGSTPNTYPGALAALTPSPSKARNFVISKLGHGGALDRSSYKEDYRRGASKYIPVIPTDTAFVNGCFYFEKPVEEEDPTTGAVYYWLPIELVPNVHAAAVSRYTLLFQFDEEEWNPEPSSAAPTLGDITIRFPTERLGSAPGLVAAKVTDAAGTPNPAGEYIHLDWNGPTVANTWTTHPSLSLAQRRKNPLVYIRFLKRTANSVMGMGIVPITSTLSTGGGTPVGALVWADHFIGAANSHNNNAKAQCIDWSYKSNEVSEGGGQIKARGIYAKMNSHGRGLPANRLVPGWIWGLYNVILGSDSKEYTSQVVDYDENITTITDKGTIRSRFRNAAGNMATRVFSGDPKWGSQGNSAHGDYLIDDQQTDDIATSDSVKGQRISYMVFGFIQDKAEALSIRNLTGVFRRGGSRRRTGR